jgi:ubiquinone/menaquinone biosynthesis C-methylase UbiE
VGYLLASPLRKLIQNPTAILKTYVQEGMTALDIGSAMGFFTLPLARLVGPKGKVFAVDMQEKMLTVLDRRACKAGLGGRIETRLCTQESLGIRDLSGHVNFVLLFAVVHEMPDALQLFAELASVLKPGGVLLLAEPTGHVKASAFEVTVKAAQAAGLTIATQLIIPRSHAVLLHKPPTNP